MTCVGSILTARSLQIREEAKGTSQPAAQTKIRNQEKIRRKPSFTQTSQQQDKTLKRPENHKINHRFNLHIRGYTLASAHLNSHSSPTVLGNCHEPSTNGK